LSFAERSSSRGSVEMGKKTIRRKKGGGDGQQKKRVSAGGARLNPHREEEREQPSEKRELSPFALRRKGGKKKSFIGVA